MATDALAQAALTALDGAIGAITLPATPPGISREVRVLPERVRPRFLGGYVGQHPDPRGSVQAREVRGVLDVRVNGGLDRNATTHLASVVRTYLAQSPADLRGQGIERLTLRPAAEPDPRGAQFDLHYEYRHLPTTSEGVIQTLDLGLDANVTPYKARYRFDVAARTLAGDPQPLAQFQPANDTDLDPGSPAGAWSYNAPAQAIAQTAATRGGALTADDPRKGGAQLLWRIGGAPLALARFIAVVEFESASAQGVGLVFGRTGANDRWHFLMSQAGGYHLFGRKTGVGAWHTVGAPASAGFATGVRHTLAITVFDHTLRAALDGVQTLEVHSDDPVPAGEIGFFTHGNNGARFHRMRLLELV